MKFLILATAAIVIFSSSAIAQERIAEDDPQSAGVIIAANADQKADAVKLAMGPTSAPQKPGGTGATGGSGEGQKSPTPSTHKRPKHRHRHS